MGNGEQGTLNSYLAPLLTRLKKRVSKRKIEVLRLRDLHSDPVFTPSPKWSYPRKTRFALSNDLNLEKL